MLKEVKGCAVKLNFTVEEMRLANYTAMKKVIRRNEDIFFKDTLIYQMSMIVIPIATILAHYYMLLNTEVLPKFVYIIAVLSTISICAIWVSKFLAKKKINFLSEEDNIYNKLHKTENLDDFLLAPYVRLDIKDYIQNTKGVDKNDIIHTISLKSDALYLIYSIRDNPSKVDMSLLINNAVVLEEGKEYQIDINVHKNDVTIKEVL